MALFEFLTSTVAGKAAAAAAGLTIAGGAVAGASGNLPDGLQEQLAEIAPAFSGELPDDAEVPDDAGPPDEVGAADEADAADDDGSETARRVHDVLNGDQDVWPGDEGFGAAVSENARTNPDFGSEVADAASNGRSGGPDDAASTQSGDDAQDNASEGLDKADEASDEGDDASDAADGGDSDAEQGDEHRPEGAPPAGPRQSG